MKNTYPKRKAAIYGFRFTCWLVMPAIATACTKSQDPENEVPFAPELQISTVLTKALDDVFETGDRIGIFAVKWEDDVHEGILLPSGNYADNVSFTKGSTESEWLADQKIYMPGDQSKLTLYAYYPYNENMTLDQNSRFMFSIKPDLREHADYTSSDLCTATAIASWTNNCPRLTFNHALSQLVFAFEAGQGFTPAEMEKADIRILNSWVNANVSLPAGAPSPDSNITEEIIPGGEWVLSPDGRRVTGKKAIFMPHQVLGSRIVTL